MNDDNKQTNSYFINYRARVKSGLRIIGIEPNVDRSWNITTDFNPRRTHATITAVRKYDPKLQQHKRLKCFMFF